MTSKHETPSSSQSTVVLNHVPITNSPRTQMTQVQEQHLYSHRRPSRIQHGSARDENILQTGDPESRTYEALWAQGQKMGSSQPIISPSSVEASLEPPKYHYSSQPSSNVRRTHSPKSQQPPVLRTTSSISQDSQTSQNTSVPHTPRAKPVFHLQTPAQKSLQEQDAIETLMFLSSPNNSGAPYNSTPNGTTILQPQANSYSPRKSENMRESPPSNVGRKVEFANPAQVTVPPERNPPDITSVPSENSFKRPRNGSERLKPHNIDEILDQMAENESSDEEITIPTSSKRVEWV